MSQDFTEKDLNTLSQYCTLAQIVVHCTKLDIEGNRVLRLPDDQDTLRGFFTARTNYLKFSPRELRKLLDAHDIWAIRNANRSAMTDLLVLNDGIRHQYLKFRMAQLKTFAKSRGIKSNIRTKAALMKILEENDQFPKFLELPGELRNKVYKMHFEEMSHQVSVPRLTVKTDYGLGYLDENNIGSASHRLRDESTPIFYKTRRFPLLPPKDTCFRTVFDDVEGWHNHVKEANLADIRLFILELEGVPTSAGCIHKINEAFVLVNFDRDRAHYKYSFTSLCGCWREDSIEEVDAIHQWTDDKDPCNFSSSMARLLIKLDNFKSLDGAAPTRADFDKLLTWNQDEEESAR